jgi:hypothetical protein
MKMTARILTELSVGLTPELQNAVKLASEFSGMKPSQLGRMALVEKMVRDGFMEHPGKRLMNVKAANAG